MKYMSKQMIVMLAAVLTVLVLVFGYKMFGTFMMKKFMAGAGAPVQTVSTIKAGTQDWQPKLTAVGSLRAVNGADLSSEVSGIVQAIAFESGSDVQRNAVLVQLRADDDMAKLRALQASEKLASIVVARDQKQIKAQAISQATLDSDVAAYESARAQTAAQIALVEKKTIRAPFAGHLGIRQVDIGQYLQPGTSIATLQQLDPIYVDFTLPEQAITQIKADQSVSAIVDALKDQSFDGTIDAINSKIDPGTRSIQVRATFKNHDHVLLPGMFANIVVNVGEPQKSITLPQAAITYNPYGNTVFIVKKDDKDPTKTIANQKFVTTGETRGDQVAIVSGVEEGDEVVTSGQIKLRNNTPVKINNEIQPSNDANPKPADR